MLIGDNLGKVVYALDLSRRAVRTVRCNLAFSFAVILTLIGSVFLSKSCHCRSVSWDTKAARSSSASMVCASCARLAGGARRSRRTLWWPCGRGPRIQTSPGDGRHRGCCGGGRWIHRGEPLRLFWISSGLHRLLSTENQSLSSLRPWCGAEATESTLIWTAVNPCLIESSVDGPMRHRVSQQVGTGVLPLAWSWPTTRPDLDRGRMAGAARGLVRAGPTRGAERRLTSLPL